MEIMKMRLKGLRKESKITQEQLAQYLNVDQSLVTKLENGSRGLTVGMIDKICSLFGCTEEYLLGECEEHIPLNFAFRSNGIDAEDLEMYLSSVQQQDSTMYIALHADEDIAYKEVVRVLDIANEHKMKLVVATKK